MSSKKRSQLLFPMGIDQFHKIISEKKNTLI